MIELGRSDNVIKIITRGARFGLTSDRTLVYVTGGPAFGHIKASLTDLQCSTCDIPGSARFQACDSSNHWGVAVGAGVEYALTENRILRGAYMHLDFSAKNFLWANGIAMQMFGAYSLKMTFLAPLAVLMIPGAVIERVFGLRRKTCVWT
jgi:opacity protein-like surface antigen